MPPPLLAIPFLEVPTTVTMFASEKLPFHRTTTGKAQQLLHLFYRNGLLGILVHKLTTLDSAENFMLGYLVRIGKYEIRRTVFSVVANEIGKPTSISGLNESINQSTGEWESEVRLGGKHQSALHLEMVQVQIRQVPGDGNCLFHSISTCQAHIVNGTQLQYPNHLGWLYRHSASLREQAVDCLRQKRKTLFLQGNEHLRANDLVAAAAAQYGISACQYCDLMQQDSYWGGKQGNFRTTSKDDEVFYSTMVLILYHFHARWAGNRGLEQCLETTYSRLRTRFLYQQRILYQLLCAEANGLFRESQI